jgi:hypothetical protein
VRYRISSQETIKYISCRDQAGGKVFAPHLPDAASIKAAFSFPYGVLFMSDARLIDPAMPETC